MIFILTLISCYFNNPGTSTVFILLYRKTELYGFSGKKISTANNVLVDSLYNAQLCHNCPRSLTQAIIHALPFLLIYLTSWLARSPVFNCLCFLS